jgi:hypothetical protein
MDRRSELSSAPFRIPNPLRGCNADLAQVLHHSITPSLHHSITPSLRAAGFEDEDDDEDEAPCDGGTLCGNVPGVETPG